MKKIFYILIKQAPPLLPRVSFVFLLILLTIGFEALAPWPFKVLLDNVLGNEVADSTTTLGQLIGLFTSREALGFAVVLIYAFLSMGVDITAHIRGVVVKKINATVVSLFAQQGFRNFEYISPGYYKNQQIGDYIYRLSYDVAALGELVEGALLPLITHGLYLIVTIIVIIFINKTLAILALAMLPFLVFCLWIFNYRIGVISQRSETSNSLLFSFIEEMLSQIKIVQAYNQQTHEIKTFSEREDKSLSNELDMHSLNLLLNLVIGVIIAVGYAVVMSYGVHLVSVGQLTTGLLIVFIFYLDNLTSPVMSLINASSTMRESWTKVQRLNDFFTNRFHTADKGHLTAIEDSSITFKNVTITGDEDTTILKNVSCSIPFNKKTVIVGVSGSGKTTMASLILRFIEPTSGQVLLGGRDIHSYSLETLREAIAYVPQEIILFNSTIHTNIAFSNPRAPLASVREAARLAVADQFIEHLPGKYAFRVGEAGRNLSGGQRQRLMLARAFMKEHASIVIFDEPLSALDVKTRQTLMDNIDEFSHGKTVIIISNVLEIINRADYVIIVNQGTILQSGVNKELLKESKLAKILFEAS